MPYESPKQKRFMEGCRNNPGGMEGKCPPKKVLDEFHGAAKAAGQFKKKPRPPKGTMWPYS